MPDIKLLYHGDRIKIMKDMVLEVQKNTVDKTIKLRGWKASFIFGIDKSGFPYLHMARRKKR